MRWSLKRLGSVEMAWQYVRGGQERSWLRLRRPMHGPGTCFDKVDHLNVTCPCTQPVLDEFGSKRADAAAPKFKS